MHIVYLNKNNNVQILEPKLDIVGLYFEFREPNFIIGIMNGVKKYSFEGLTPLERYAVNVNSVLTIDSRYFSKTGRRLQITEDMLINPHCCGDSSEPSPSNSRVISLSDPFDFCARPAPGELPHTNFYFEVLTEHLGEITEPQEGDRLFIDEALTQPLIINSGQERKTQNETTYRTDNTGIIVPVVC